MTSTQIRALAAVVIALMASSGLSGPQTLARESQPL